MNLLSWLMVGHLAGDYLLQNRWMAVEKSKNWFPLLIHAAVYTFSVTLFAFFGGGIRITAVIIILVSHAMLDQRAVVRWWAQRVTQSADIHWLTVMIDQTWHIVILAFISLL